MTHNPPDFRNAALDAAHVRAALDLKPHPEGGHYRELWRAAARDGERGAASSIFFLLAAGERSHWHRIDASEIWIWQAGAPLCLELFDPATSHDMVSLGPDAGKAERFQAFVPAFVWQAARSLGAWTLVSCIVAPAFQFEGFELAHPGWTPPPRQ
jgi:predicted cupin superfamily sugar epimerase